MSNYQKGKEQARENAIEWQIKQINEPLSYEDIYIFTKHFEKTAKRYGLIKEFRENGII